MSTVFAILFVLTLFSSADGISCIVCDSITTSSCGETYTADSSTPTSGFSSCFKIVYTSSSSGLPPGYVSRGGYVGSSTCLPVNTGSSTTYCCSDKDSCNGSMKSSASILLTLIGMIALSYRKSFLLI